METMNLTQLLTQMSWMAGAVAQSTLPAGPAQTEPHDRGDSFQSLLEDKRAQADRPADGQRPEQSGQTDREPQQTAPEDPGQPEQAQPDQQAAILGLPLMTAGLDPMPLYQLQPAAPEEGAAQPVLLQPEGLPAPRMPQTGEPPQGGAVLPQTGQTPETAVRSDGTALPQTGETAPSQPQPIRDLTAPASQSGGGQAQSGQTEGGTQARDLPDGAAVQTAQAMPQLRDLEPSAVRVGEGEPLEASSSQLDGQLSQTILKTAAEGESAVRVALTPEHLGSVVVELTRDSRGVLHVVLTAEREQTLHLLRDHADTLGLMLQNGGQGEVRLEVNRAQEGQHTWQQPDPNGGQQEQQNPRQQPRQPREESEDFLHQLRLGLAGREDTAL